MTEYFGNTDTGNSWGNGLQNYAWMNVDMVFTCPGVGNQNLVELSAYAFRSEGGAVGNIRLALYTTDHTIITQGAAEAAVASTDIGWVGHTGMAGTVLTGGDNYEIALTCDGADVNLMYEVGLDGDFVYDDVDYTGGFPAAFDVSITDTWCWSIRAGVEAEAVGDQPGVNITGVHSPIISRRLPQPVTEI